MPTRSKPAGKAPAAKPKPRTPVKAKAATKKPTVKRTPARPPATKATRPKRVLIGPVKRMMTSQRIAAARHKASPDEWKVIAEREGLPMRTCQHMYTRFVSDSGLLAIHDATGQKVLDETLLTYEGLIELFVEGTDKGETWAVKLGAGRSLLDVLRQRIELLVVMGRMPRSPQAHNDRLRVERMIREMAEVLERHNAEPEMIQDLLAVIDALDEVPETPALNA